jgi:putative transposase
MEKQFKPFFTRYDFNIQPTEAQKVLFANTFGACRYVYNELLTNAKAEYEAYKQSYKTTGVTEHKNSSAALIELTCKLSTKFTAIKSQEENAWLKDVPDSALQLSAIELINDLEKFFKNKEGYLEFKKKRNKQLFSLSMDAFRFKEGKLYIDKSEEPLEVLYFRDLPSKPSSLTISKTSSNKYCISFFCVNTPN